MKAEKIVEGLFSINLGKVNAFLLEDGDGLVLIDAGYPGDGPKIIEALASIGRKPTDIRHIIVTHAHPDHIGALADMQRRSGATVLVHAADRAIVEGREKVRPLTRAPGFVSWLITTLFIGAAPTLEPAEAGGELADGDLLPFAGGLKVIHIPGHCLGQVALLWGRHGGMLFAADACMNMLGLRDMPGYEDIEEGRRSLKKLSRLTFDKAVFGHGGGIKAGAEKAFRARWGAEPG